MMGNLLLISNLPIIISMPNIILMGAKLVRVKKKYY